MDTKKSAGIFARPHRVLFPRIHAQAHPHGHLPIMYTDTMFTHYRKAALLGVAVAAVFFLLLLFAGYDQTAVETVLGVIVFLIYTQTPLYHKEHGRDPKSIFYSFLAYV